MEYIATSPYSNLNLHDAWGPCSFGACLAAGIGQIGRRHGPMDREPCSDPTPGGPAYALSHCSADQSTLRRQKKLALLSFSHFSYLIGSIVDQYYFNFSCYSFRTSQEMGSRASQSSFFKSANLVEGMD